ncbi:hypothetical protein HZA40_04250 [Candidatus Peregrinibacteria bacterium]|nr:hypothetical protein [Candidatus Peregrinibacteria bacterium]
MVFKNKVPFILITALLASSLNFSVVAFAETDAVNSDPTVCSGRITGVTNTYNPNSGVVSFDAHDGPGFEDGAAISLSITGNNPGLAPANRSDAACISKIAGNAYAQAYDYALKGWAWDTNGGFVSFNCASGSNNAGGVDVPCGAFDYGVYISPVQGGIRNLFGYAWNPTLGWIKFKNDPGDSIAYGVTIDVNTGKSSGYAWTSAGVYIDFSGLTLNLPDKAVVVVGGNNWCQGKVGLCVDIAPDPSNLSFSSNLAVKVADGVDGYNVDIYLRDANGNGIDPNDYNPANMGRGKGIAPPDYYDFAKSIKFDWGDTVKLDQVNDVKVGTSLNMIQSPSSVSSPKGAVTFKPMNFFDDFTQAYVEGAKDPGHFVSKKIASYAPTSESKLSLTTSTKPAYYVNNETFLSKPDNLFLPSEKNQLVLKNISYPELIDGFGNTLIQEGVIYPNGKVDLPLKFRPAIYVDNLYAGDLQDSILAYRSVPFFVRKSLAKIGNLGAISNDTVDFHMTYSNSQTTAQSDCAGATFNFTVFDNLTGKTLAVSSDVDVQNKISDLLKSPTDLNITADIPLDPNAKLPCKVASGADVYSVISYSVAGKTVKYYDNKLPRIGGDTIQNPAVVVHGNIYAQSVGNVSGDQRAQTAGSVNVNLIRDAINENLQKYAAVKIANLNKSYDPSNVCSVSGLKEDSQKKGTLVSSCAPGSYASFDVGTEHVAYFKGMDVSLKLPNDKQTSVSDFSGKWVIVADGGNIFVDNNLYISDLDKANLNRISLIVLRSAKDADYYRTGNIYIAPNVRNLQGTFVADGSMFSYDGNHADIDNVDKGTGEPKWSDYSTMIKTLSSQLFIKGALFSANTIGGANLDQGNNAKPYLLGGGGKVIESKTIQDRMKAQYYDLNYLRMFRLDLQLGASGLPIDQKCGKALTPQDQLDILVGKTICGAKQPCDVSLGQEQVNACNGINPLLKYDAQNTDGDLIVPTDDSSLADGLEKTKDFDPVYVYYKAPDKDSFVFSKEGAVNVGGK